VLVLRPVLENDLESIYDLASKAETGMTTLPCDMDVLQNRIKESVKSFSFVPSKPGGESYFFVLEDVAKKKIVGTAAIFSKVGGYQPFYTYKVCGTHKESKTLNVKKDIQYLQLVMIHNGPTEMGTLFLLPEYRHGGNGRLLSLSRFMFMAEYKKCFEPYVIVELRGVLDKNDHSPFWDALGKHFFEVDFRKADLMVMRDKSFIADLMPEHPIYIPLLPEAAQKVIGKVHENTLPALHMLEGEGFQFNDEIDIFEAGPVMKATLGDIRTVRQSQNGIVTKIVQESSLESNFLIANVDSFHNFRVVKGDVKVLSGNEVQLSKDIAEAVRVKNSSRIRFVPIK
jgi:arginine N-succinyltransferase